MQIPTTFDEESSLLHDEAPQQQPRKLNVFAVTASIVAAGLLATGAYISEKGTGSTTSVTDLGRISGYTYSKSTNKNQDGSLVFMDRHHMTCDDADAMVGFRVTDRLRFTYTCTKVSGLALQGKGEFITTTVHQGGLNYLVSMKSYYIAKSFFLSSFTSSSVSNTLSTHRTELIMQTAIDTETTRILTLLLVITKIGSSLGESVAVYILRNHPIARTDTPTMKTTAGRTRTSSWIVITSCVQEIPCSRYVMRYLNCSHNPN